MTRCSSPSLRRGGRLLLAGAALLGLACGHGKVNRHIDRSPDVDFGASATILRPGQEPPPMGGWQGGGRMTSLGGARQNERRHVQSESGGHGGPFAVVGAPLAKVQEMATGGGEREEKETAAPARPPTREELQEEQERQELERLREQLGGAPPAPPPAPRRTARAVPSAAPRSPSLAEERALLERRLAPGSARSGRAAPGGPAAAPGSGGEVADRAVDRNGDGRPDYWVYRAGERTTREVYDDTGDGRADRIVRYDPADGRIVEVEEDTDGDGDVDAWSHYEAGTLARRLADENGDGRVDTWALYREARLARLERDEDGDGFRDRVALYRDGRLEREEIDADEDGRPEVRTWYDENEAVRLREEDRNGDGEVDVRSHYESGRLVRREVLDESALGSELPGDVPAEARSGAGGGAGS